LVTSSGFRCQACHLWVQTPQGIWKTFLFKLHQLPLLASKKSRSSYVDMWKGI
jgi:hypothetical protein